MHIYLIAVIGTPLLISGATLYWFIIREVWNDFAGNDD